MINIVDALTPSMQVVGIMVAMTTVSHIPANSANV